MILLSAGQVLDHDAFGRLHPVTGPGGEPWSMVLGVDRLVRTAVVSQSSFLDLHIYSRQPPGTSLRREDQSSYYRIGSTDFELRKIFVVMSSSISC